MSLDVDTSEQRFLLDAVAWESYEDFLRGLDDRHVFVTYDRGRMELMSPSWKHDSSAELIATIIRVVAEETGVGIRGGGSTTFRRKDLERGLEPDRCFYVRNEPKIRGKRTIDLQRDPPPDIAIEIEISTRLLDRVGIYAAMGVPELWRYDGKRLTVEVLSEAARYESAERSPTFPDLLPRQIEAFLDQSDRTDDTTWIRSVRKWIQENIAAK